MLFASGSGIDPHVSPEAALLQVERICKVRNFNSAQRQNLVEVIVKLTEKPQYSLFGKERINVFLLNLELDKIQ
jgi:K+-transporting ATPase ATPase C chain